MPNCGCSGQSCGCRLVSSTGTTVTGTGTISDPFKVAINPGSLGLSSAITSANSNTVELTRVGSGSAGDPLVFTAGVVLRSPDNSRWAPSISNSGTVTWAKL